MKKTIDLKLGLLVLLSITIFLFSCEKNEDDLSTDSLLKNELVGSWYISDSKTISFNENNTFIDTTFAIFNDRPGEYQIHDIIAGNYSIENGQLNFSNIELLYCKAQENESVGSLYIVVEPICNINIDNNSLEIEANTIFSAVENSTSNIFGEWSFEVLIAVYDKNLENKFTGGTRDVLYNFESGSNELELNYKYTYDNK